MQDFLGFPEVESSKAAGKAAGKASPIFGNYVLAKP
jgi:hypothetical protein